MDKKTINEIYGLVKNILKEGMVPFPDEQELKIMTGLMDGKSLTDIATEWGISSAKVQKLLKSGMERANVKNLYELVVWGLRTGIISDPPRKEDIQAQLNLGANDKANYPWHSPLWLQILNFTITGETDKVIGNEVKISNTSLDYWRKWTSDKFGLGPSMAKYIRFGFAALNPITGPPQMKIVPAKIKITKTDKVTGKPIVSKVRKSIKVAKPFTPSMPPFSNLKYPPVLSKYRPADIDPNFVPVYGTTSGKKSGSIQIAFQMLGVPRETIAPYETKKTFWNRKTEWLWSMLELAQRRYEWEMKFNHPDKNPNVHPNRPTQITGAWKFIKNQFAKHGYVLGGGEGTPDKRGAFRRGGMGSYKLV